MNIVVNAVEIVKIFTKIGENVETPLKRSEMLLKLLRFPSKSAKKLFDKVRKIIKNMKNLVKIVEICTLENRLKILL